MNPINRLRRSILVALAATMVIAAPAFAVTSQVSSETLSVNSSLALTGVPATLAYGAGNVSSTVTAPDITATVTTNDPDGSTLRVTASDLANGANIIASTNRAFKVTAGTGTPTVLTPWDGTNGGPYTGSMATLAYKGAAGEWTAVVSSRVNIPASAAPGAYTGTLTFSVADRP